jgi:hypothetical protein
MTDTEAKALALLNEVRSEYPFAADYHAIGIALNRALEQHEAFKQEVSDALVDSWYHNASGETLERFIIPKAEPDPLVEVLEEISGEGGFDNYDHYAHNIHAALEARGLEIREKGQ